MTAYLLAQLKLESTDRVLEVGCQDGALALELARKAGYVAGVDSSPEFVAAAEDRRLLRAADNLSFGSLAADRLPFDDESFDLVISRDALHRLADPSSVVKDMARVLRPTGRLYLADVVGADDHVRREAQEKIELAHFGPPINLYTATAMSALAAFEPLEVVRQLTFTQELNAVQWIRPDRIDAGTRDKLLRLVAPAVKRKAREPTAQLERHWVLIIAEKTGSL